MIASIFTLKCPHCHRGSIRAGLFQTAAQCPVCGKVFAKESGFYAGAIYSMYGASGLLGGMTALFCLFALGWRPFPSVLAGCILVALLSPYLFWLSRSAFLHAEERFFKNMKGL